MKTPWLRLGLAVALALAAATVSADDHRRPPHGHSHIPGARPPARFHDHDRFRGDRHFHDRDRFHSHFGLFIGPSLYSDPFYWNDYPYRPPVYFTAPQPPIYIQQNQQPYYWYWCQDPPGYYPYVQSCPRPWQPVVPYSTPPR